MLYPKSDTFEDYKRIVVLKGVRSRDKYTHVSKPNIPNCGQSLSQHNYICTISLVVSFVALYTLKTESAKCKYIWHQGL